MMNKKAMVFELGAIIIILITTFGVYKVLSKSSHIYIGNKANLEVYDYKFCPGKINNIPESDRVSFDTLKDAEDNRYKKVEGCI